MARDHSAELKNVTNPSIHCAGSVEAARSAIQQAGGGANPTLALHCLRVGPVPVALAKQLLIRHHYLHSVPGGTRLAFGVFHGQRLKGALTLGVGQGKEVQPHVPKSRL